MYRKTQYIKDHMIQNNKVISYQCHVRSYDLIKGNHQKSNIRSLKILHKSSKSLKICKSM